MQAPAATNPPRTADTPGVWLGRWLSKGSWAVLDQALFSVANFGVLLLLARWLAPADFGRFTVAYTAFLLMSTVYSALVVEALLVLGPRRFADRLAGYVGALFLLQLPVAAGVAFILGMAAVVCILSDAASLGVTLLLMAAGAPLILLLWLARRPPYVHMQPHRAAVGGAVYLAAVLLPLQALASAGKLSTSSAIAVMSLASVAAVVVLLIQTPLRWPRKPEEPLLRETAAAHWDYGKWAMGSAFLGMLPTQLAYLVLPEFQGVEASAALRAVSNLILPLIQINIALSAILLPAMARHRGTSHATRLTVGGAAILVLVPLAAWAVLGALGEPLLKLCYGEQYAGYGWLVWLIGVSPALLGLTMLLNIMLQARGRQDAVFYGSLASAICACTVGVALIAHDGLRGAAVGVNVSLFVAVVIAGAFLLSGSEQQDSETAGGLR